MICTHLLLCLLNISDTVFNHVEARLAFERERRLEGEGIVGGTDAKEGQVPYQISLESRGQSICGGSILSERFVITAAHCVINKYDSFEDNPLKVVAGITDLKSKPKSRVAVDVVQVFVPKEYNGKLARLHKRSTGDIAILKLNKDLGIKDNFKLSNIQLPKKSESYEGKIATISGFGVNYVEVAKSPINGELKEVNEKYYDKMRFAKARVLGHKECEEIYATMEPIAKTHICAALEQRGWNGPEGVCSGDSGGPLVYEGAQIGVVSTSPLGCREDQRPAVYTRVSDYLGFIKKALEEKIDNNIRTIKLEIHNY